MIYYPKSHITPNLYSNGNLSFKDTFQPYTGYYFAAVDGKNFTGRFPGDGNNLELIPTLEQSYPSPEVAEANNAEDPRFYPKNATYSRINNVKYGVGIKNPPIPFYPQPTTQDYELGEFTRYFAKKINNEIYYETSDLYKNSLYISFSLPWSIRGGKEDVYHTNKNIVELKQQQNNVSGLGVFLKHNYLKFYK